MKPTIGSKRAAQVSRSPAALFHRGWPGLVAWCVVAFGVAFSGGVAQASIAYGTINNFDVVNDTGSEAHGFEIEIDDVHSTAITYTYNWNHYGVPKITEDNADPAHPRVFIRYESAKNPDGTWAAFTAVPSGPIPPTQGHQFTDPSVNFGGEHFGAGYSGTPSAIKYNWLIDDGTGNLVHGPPVLVSTPTFTYVPPAAGVPAQVQAVIKPPPPPAPEPLEFGKANWVKEIRTTTHNNNEVKLRDLVDPDPAGRKDWRNGEPDEVEVEWQIQQTDYNAGGGGGKNGELAGAPEDLPGGDEIITRRYEFYEYLGPIDNETGEAMADQVAPDGVHGVGTVTVNGVEIDLSTIEVVGKFLGAQMSGFDVDAGVGLIDHLEDGMVNTPYPDRAVVIAGSAPFTATSSGALPAGLSFNAVTGIVAGTPTEGGTFSFTVNAQDANTPVKTKTYIFTIAAEGEVLPPHSVVDTSVTPVGSGTTTGAGSYDNGTNITVVATPSAGFTFVSWTDNGKVVSNSASYSFTTDVNRSLVANFSTGLPTLSVNSPLPVNEGSAAAPGAVTFTVTLSAAAAQTVTVAYQTVDGTAKAGLDYTSKSGTLTFLAGDTTKPIVVPFVGDALNEADETFSLKLSNPVNAVLIGVPGLGTIANDDPVLTLSINDGTQVEPNTGTTNLIFTVTLSAPSGQNVTVNYATANGTATAGTDYTSTAGTLTFTPGQTSKPLSVPVKGDTLDEPNETFKMSLSGAVNATIADGLGVGTITDNDPTPRFFIDDVSVTEANTSQVAATFHLTLSAASARTVTVTYRTADGTAKAGADYVAIPSTTLTFNPGQTSKTIVVQVKGDLVDEGNETFKVVLQTATNAAIVDNKGVGTILDNDPLPSLRISDASTQAEGNAGATHNALFVVTLTGATARTVTVNYATANGTATAGSDYTAASGTITFLPGQTSKTLPIQVLGDTVLEPDETFKVNLSGASFATITDPQGVHTITDDDTSE